MLHTRISSEPPRRQATGSPRNSDLPLVVVIDPRRLIGQCTAAGLQDADTGIRFRSCRTVDEWLDEDHDSTALLLLSGTAPELDLEIASVAGCYAAPPFAIVSPDTDPSTISRYLLKGARGFIATSQPRAEVLNALRLIAAGHIVVPTSTAPLPDRAAVSHS